MYNLSPRELEEKVETELRSAGAAVKQLKPKKAIAHLKTAYADFDRLVNLNNTSEEQAYRDRPLVIRIINNLGIR